MTEQERQKALFELVYLLNSDKRQKIELNDYSFVVEGVKLFLFKMVERNVK